MLYTESRYTVVGSALAGIIAGALYARLLMDAPLRNWSYVVFIFAAFGAVSLWRDAWSLYYRMALFRRTPEAYEKVARVHNPGILNPARPGNPEAIKEEARVAVANVKPLMNKLGITPEAFDTDNPSSVKAWYDCLRPFGGKDY